MPGSSLFSAKPPVCNQGLRAFRQGLIFASGRKRRRLSREASEQEVADAKRQKTYLKDVQKRSLIQVHFWFKYHKLLCLYYYWIVAEHTLPLTKVI